MYRGEPVAIHTIMIGLVGYLLTLLFGIRLSGIIYFAGKNLSQVHYTLAYFVWIAPVILGSQLQFNRALTGLRKFQNEYLRRAYLFFLILGIIIIITGTLLNLITMTLLGFIFYSLTILIHFYWLLEVRRTKQNIFPLNYFFQSNIFLLIAFMILITDLSNSQSSRFQDVYGLTHLLSIGWINLSLQGAILRILPMFVGRSLKQRIKSKLGKHNQFSLISASVASLSYYLIEYSEFFNILYLISIFLVALSWIWIVYALIYLLRSSKPFINKVTLIYFIPGMIFSVAGFIMGGYSWFSSDIVFRRLHIHLSLLFGLSFIMLGAIHRISTFQIYTILYTGKTQTAPSISTLQRDNIMSVIGILLFIIKLVMLWAFIIDNLVIVGISGIFLTVIALSYCSVIAKNYVLYFKERSNAIPFDLKPSEYEK